MNKLVAAVLCVLALAGEAEAQIVNVLPLARKPGEGVSGSVDFKVDWRTGNTELVQLGGTARLAWLTGRHLLLLALSGELGVKSDDRFLAHTFEHLRYRVGVVGPLSMEVFAQHEYDEFRRLTLRAVGGAGPRVEAVSWEGGFLAFGTAYMAEYEELGEATASDSGAKRLNHRWSSYVSLEAALDDTVTLSQTAYVQPRLDGFADLRVLDETALTVSVAEWVVISTSFRLTYDANPPEGVQSLDTALGTSLGVSF